MKIYKIAAQPQFPLIPQNVQPNSPVNPDAQLQNLQQSQQAMQFLQELVSVTSELAASVSREIDDKFGINTGLGQLITQKVQAAIPQTNAWNVLSKQNLMTNPNDLSNNNTMSMLNTRIQNQIGQMGNV